MIAIAVLAILCGLANPERGFRFEQKAGLEDGEKQGKSNRSAWRFAEYAKDGVRITQAYCYLTEYCESDIPQSKLDALQADFDRARREGVKVLLRFAYETDMSRKRGPTAERILSHIRELTPIVRANADVIYVLQCGWVGAWGEFHSSAHRLEYDEVEVPRIVKATLDMLPENRVTMMRTSYQRSLALAGLGGDCEVNAETARGKSPAARIGFFNDATLANYHDSGTFLHDRKALAGMAWDEILGLRFDQPGAPVFDRMARESVYVPVDGELFWTGHVDPLRQNGLAAIQRLRQHHYTTLSIVHGNSELDMNGGAGAIDAWKSSPVTPELLAAYGIPFEPGYFAGVPYRSAYEYIRDHLGYRLVAKSCVVSDGKVRLTVHNYGFAAPVNPRKASFAVLSADGAVAEIPTDFDCRRLLAERDAVIEASVPRLENGENLALWLPDESERIRRRSEYAIALAGGAEVKTVGGFRLNVLAVNCHKGDGE